MMTRTVVAFEARTPVVLNAPPSTELQMTRAELAAADAIAAKDLAVPAAATASAAATSALASEDAAEAAQGIVTAMLTGQGKPYANAYASTLPKGITSVTIGGDPITGATVGEYAITGSGGSITGYNLTLVVTSATAAYVRIETNPDGSKATGLGSGTTPPTLTKPAGATLPAGTTLTAVVGPRIAVGEPYAVISADGLEFQLFYNNAGSIGPFIDASGVQVTAPTSRGVAANSLHPGSAEATTAEKAAMACIEAPQFFGVPAGKRLSWKYLFWKDVGTRFNATAVMHDDITGTGAVECATFSVGSGADAWTTPRLIEMNAVGGSGVTGSFIFNPPAAALTMNSASANSATYQRRRISQRTYRTSAARTADIAAQINTTLAPLLPSAGGKFKPFLDTHDATGSSFTTDFLRKFVKNAWVYCAGKKTAVRISYMRLSTSATCYIDLYDDTAGRRIAQWLAPAIVGTFTNQPRFVKGGQGGQPLDDYTGDYFVLELDWTQVAATIEGPLSSQTRGGLHPDCLFDDDEAGALSMSDAYQEVIPIGPSRTYTTIAAALSGAIYDTGVICYRARPHYKIALKLDAGTHYAHDAFIPEFVSVIGAGRDVSIIDYAPAQTITAPPLQTHRDSHVLDLTVKSISGDGGSNAGQYCIHSDDVRIASWGGTGQRRRIRQRFERLHLITGALQNTNALGGGFSSGQIVKMKDIQVTRLNPTANSADMSAHNTAASGSYPTISAQTLPVLWEVDGFRSNNVIGAGIQVVSLGSGSSGSVLSVSNCEAQRIAREITTASGHEWTISGVFGGAVSQPTNSTALPNTGFRRRLTNSTGSTLAANRLVKRTGDATIAYAGPGDTVLGWLPDAIANGATGDVIISKVIFGAFLSISGAGTSGQFGLAANGQIDFSASTKVGEIYSGVARLY